MSRPTIVASPTGLPARSCCPTAAGSRSATTRRSSGACPTARCPLSDPQVSRHHAEVRRSEHGFLVVDLDSTNGTLVNGVRVGAGALLATAT